MTPTRLKVYKEFFDPPCPGGPRHAGGDYPLAKVECMECVMEFARGVWEDGYLARTDFPNIGKANPYAEGGGS